MRRLLVVPCAAWIAACYSPNDEVTTGGADDSEGSGSGSTAGMTASSATTTPADTSGDTPADTGDTTDDPTDDTGEDAPPVIESFSVQGSLLPAEILMADTVVLAADVTDDVGVARVEFYDGGTLVATVDGAPWRTEFLVTSADNGGHSYTAVAYDTAEQTADAGPIPMSVNIDGGAVIELREEVFRSRNSLWVFSAPAPSVAPDGDVFLAGTALYEGAGFTNARLTTIRYSPALSELWQRDYPSSMTAVTPALRGYSAPVVNGDSVVLMTASSNGNTYLDNSLRPLAADDGSVGSSIDLPISDPGSIPARGVAVDDGGNMIAVTMDGVVFKLDAFGNSVWQADALTGVANGTYFPRVSLDPAGNVLVDIVELGGEETFLRKYSTDGELLWTRDNGWASQALADGTIVSVGAWFSTDVVSLIHRDGDGNELSSSDLDIEIPYTVAIADIAMTPDGDVVCAGMRQTPEQVPEAWVARANADGDTLWWTLVEVGERAAATGVAMSQTGRLYVSGHANDVSAQNFLEFFADAWIAELAL